MHPIEHLRYVARASGVDSIDLAREAAVALGSLRTDNANLVIACRRIIERHPEVAQLWWLCANLLTAPDPAGLAWDLADAVDATGTADCLVLELPESATVVTWGAPSVVGEALVQRPDVRVWCCGEGREASGFQRYLERNDVVCARASAITELPEGCEIVLLEPVAAARSQLLVPVGAVDLVTLAGAAPPAGTAQSVGVAGRAVEVWAVVAPGTRLPPEYVAAIADRVGERHSVGSVAPATVDRVVTAAGVDTDVVAALVAECPNAPELLRTPR